MSNIYKLRLPRVELGSIAWKAIILTVGLQTLLNNEETKRTSIEKIQVERNYSQNNYNEKSEVDNEKVQVTCRESNSGVLLGTQNCPNRWCTNTIQH